MATIANNLGQILKDRGDLAGAQHYTERALQIDEKVHGPDHNPGATVNFRVGIVLEYDGIDGR